MANMDKILSQSSDTYDFSSNLELGGQDFLDSKKRSSRQQRGADGKFESLLKENEYGSSFVG